MKLLLATTLLLGPSPEIGASEQATGSGGGSAVEVAPVLLTEVLASLDEHYPLLRAAELQRDIASGALRSAHGSFDTRLLAEGDQRPPPGFYESYSGGASIDQLTTFRGVRLFGGYRIGSGDFPSYEGGRQTNDGGEVGGGIAFPLLRGGSIDPERARLRQARLDVRIAEPEIALQRVGFVREATVAYWNWLAAGLTVDVAERLLSVAEERQQQLQGRVARGALPRIDLVDNERLIVDRRIGLRGAERDFEQASISLSLFLRDATGEPLAPERERLPPDFPPEERPSEMTLEADLEEARSNHPLLRSLELQSKRLEVDLDLAKNELLPAMDFRIEATQDVGSSVPGIDTNGKLSLDPNDDTVLKAQVRLELPVQRREARGRVERARARLSRLESETRFARDRIVTEIQRAMAGLEAAFAQTEGARQNLELALRLQRAEERKLSLGTSNLINVNIREVQAAAAGVELVDSQAAYYRALAAYRAALAVP